MTDQLPLWVWDLLADLIDEDLVHGKLFENAGGTYVPYAWCPAIPLARIPDEMLRVAEYVAGYRRQVKK